MICGSLKWLNDFKANQKFQLEKLIADEDREKKKCYFNFFTMNKIWLWLFIFNVFLLRKNETGSTGFDWLTDHQENFEKNQKSLELKVLYYNSTL